jgi:hypothetical protein
MAEQSAEQTDTMLVELIPTRHSFTYAAKADGMTVRRYERGQLYKVSTALGMELLGTQRLRPATVEPPDPLEGEKEAWASMLSELASMGKDFRKRFASALATAKVGYEPSKEQLTGEAVPLPKITLPPSPGEPGADGLDADGFGELDVTEAMADDALAGVDFEDAGSETKPENLAAAEPKPAPKKKAAKKAKKKVRKKKKA